MQPSTQSQQHRLRICPGNIRLFLGLFRTPEEQQAYLQKSLKRELP